MKLLKAPKRNPGDGKVIPSEKIVDEIKFNKFKFNNRPKPDKSKIIIITCFSEFGCESIGLLYCIPYIMLKNPGAYFICVGWYGREYLYRHLVDEFWEIKEEYQWLRDLCTAFQHNSKNLDRLENTLRDEGVVFKGILMGRICLGNTCKSCQFFWGSEDENAVCEQCGSKDIERPLLANIPFHKKFAVQVPRPSMKMQNLAKKYLGEGRHVGIFARGRVCYGRNLRPEFYQKLIFNLENQGYKPIWLGEKQSVLPCPCKHIVDFSQLPEARDLELTLAIISQLEFTIQFWTASTRFASMMGVPWLLFESAEQIVGQGQEGKRIALTTDFNKKKLVIAQYWNVMEHEETGLELVNQAIQEMQNDNWDDMVGCVDNPALIKQMLAKQNTWRDL